MLEQATYDQLAGARIPSLPPNFYYFPNFITEEDAEFINSQIESKPWHELTHRRLQVFPAQLTSSNTLLTTKALPTWMTSILQPKLNDLGIFNDTTHTAMNHILVNNYRPGEGILPHEDGPAYAPVTATVSLGSPTILDIYEKATEKFSGNGQPVARLYQEPRSLLVTRDEAYETLMHGITETDVDKGINADSVANWSLLATPEKYIDAEGRSHRQERISLTCRDVVKVSTLGNRILMRRP
ncbi:MAG: hypothetical protein M1828_003519 [Chrysothrix sp. TS-e1954]|nr:MAG: hypothetical protein M1828_003519 [Chrysothrix sp. TS-e1954]